MSRTLVELSDRWDLQDLVTRYATCIDARDFDGLDRVFTPDARVSYEASGGPADDYPAVRTWLAEMLPIFASTQHLMGNLAVTLDGDTATGRWYLQDRVIVPAFDTMIIGSAFYSDTYARQDGRWVITSTGYKRTYEAMLNLKDIPSFQLTDNHLAPTGGQ